VDWDKTVERLNAYLNQADYVQLRGALRMINEVDIALYLSSLEPDQMLRVFRILPESISADVFSYMDSELQRQLIEAISSDEIRSLIDNMFLDDAVDLLEDLPVDVVRRVLSSTTPSTRALINRFLTYPANSAGSIMTIEFTELRASLTVREALEWIKRNGSDSETIYVCYVIDDGHRLLGAVEITQLLAADDDTPVTRLMDASPISVLTSTDREEVARLTRKYDLVAIPVVDHTGRLVGIVTADDVMDVIEKEDTEDLEKMAALLPSEGAYLKTSPVRLAMNRIPWLMILMLSSSLTGMIITRFQGLITTSGAFGVALVANIPMLMNTGGDSGSQVSALIVRGLALKQIGLKDILRVLWRELRVAAVVGLSLAAVTFARLMLTYGGDLRVSLVISVSMFSTVVFAKCIACMLPMLAQKLRLDPATAAGPVLTTIVDAVSLVLLFSLAANSLGA